MNQQILPAENKTESREQDILELCRQIVNMPPKVYYNPHGADSSTCPICHAQLDYADAEMEDIKHEANCGYLIAKDLSTGLL